jgi:Ca-activated chloride channel family protein
VAHEAARQKIRVYTVALGTPSGTIQVPRPDGNGVETRPVPPDPQTLAEIARITGGEAFTADDADKLRTVYDRLGSKLAKKNERRQVGYAFAGGALVLLLAGAGLSLTWMGRLV